MMRMSCLELMILTMKRTRLRLGFGGYGYGHAHNVARVKPKRSFPTGNPQKAAISKSQYLKTNEDELLGADDFDDEEDQA
jgi:hypothetical protein